MSFLECGTNMRAIDLFAGIGGWSLGLKLAGVEVVKAYEIWPQAIDIYGRNLGSSIERKDVFDLTEDIIPNDIDLVVGSPPCTEFSFANRGGSGDLQAGIAGVAAFLKVVRAVKPKFWVLENVPRLAAILQTPEASRALLPFKAELSEADWAIIDMSDFGLPQRRRRLLFGNIAVKEFVGKKITTQRRTLGDVVASLEQKMDPFFVQNVKNHEKEIGRLILNPEEARYNWELKRNHVIYNDMSFPDRMDRPSRTITATCTAMSRESIVISSAESRFRRLSTVERASLQSFPANYDLGPYSESTRFKVLGNAMPPVVAYACARHVLGREIDLRSRFPKFEPARRGFPVTLPPPARSVAAAENSSRRFRFAIKGLRFKSGMRFELNNISNRTEWRVQFYFGPPGRQECIDFSDVADSRIGEVSPRIASTLRAAINVAARCAPPVPAEDLQKHWSDRCGHATRAFDYLDHLGELAASDASRQILRGQPEGYLGDVLCSLLFETHGLHPRNERKIRSLAPQIISGFIPMILHNGRHLVSGLIVAAE